ncbi:MAG: hypothetical protein M0Z41_13240, partial [Peptococcaceae bacterium]|nr:hypothetical protein [Peptococcaceae bacterium]
MEKVSMALPHGGEPRVVVAEGHLLTRWRSVYKAVMDIHGSVTTKDWLDKSIRYVRSLLFAQEAFLAVVTGPGPELSLYECDQDDRLVQRSGTIGHGILADIFRLKNPFMRNENSLLQLTDTLALRVRN